MYIVTVILVPNLNLVLLLLPHTNRMCPIEIYSIIVVELLLVVVV